MVDLETQERTWLQRTSSFHESLKWNKIAPCLLKLLPHSEVCDMALFVRDAHPNRSNHVLLRLQIFNIILMEVIS